MSEVVLLVRRKKLSQVQMEPTALSRHTHLDAPYRRYPAAQPVESSLVALQVPFAIGSRSSEMKVLYLSSS